jgi:hypothetical protein
MLAEGKALIEITALEDMPATSTVYRWMEHHPEFSEMYNRARERQAHTIADRAVLMALRGGGAIADPQVAAVQLNAIKWAAARLAPRTFGDKMDVTSDGKQLQSVFVMNVQPASAD